MESLVLDPVNDFSEKVLFLDDVPIYVPSGLEDLSSPSPLQLSSRVGSHTNRSEVSPSSSPSYFASKVGSSTNRSEESPSPNPSQFSPRVGNPTNLGWVSLEAIDIPSRVQVNLVNSVAVQVSSQDLNFVQRFGRLKHSRLGVITGGLQKKKFGRQAVRYATSQHRYSTRGQYQGVWNKFLDFLNLNSINHNMVGIDTVANFLAYYADTYNRAFSTIAGYKCALADPLRQSFGLSLDDPDLKALLRGVYASRPPPRDGLMPRWSLSDLLGYLRGPDFEPLDKATWKALIQKTLVLFLLASGRRISEISEISRISSIKGNTVILRWLPNFRAKWDSHDFHPEEPSLSRLKPLEGADILLCPVRAWEIFVKKRAIYVNSFNNNRFWPISQKYLTNACKKVVRKSIRLAGKSEDCPMGPHQFRKLGNSLSRKFFNKPEKTLFKKVGSKSMSVLHRSYIRDVSPVSFSCVVPLGTLHPNSLPVRKI